MQTLTAPVFNDEWLAKHHEDAIEPSYPVVDAHYHLFDVEGCLYPHSSFWTDTSGGHKIAGAVYVECNSFYDFSRAEEFQSLGETETVSSLLKSADAASCSPTPSVIVSRVDLRQGFEVDLMLEAHIEASGGALRGIRQSLAWSSAFAVPSRQSPPPADLVRQPSFQNGISRLKSYGLSFDVWAYHSQLPEIYLLAKKFPDISFIIDHLGGFAGVGLSKDDFRRESNAWRKNLARLSELPNCILKLGGLGMHTHGLHLHMRPVPPSSIELLNLWRPYLEIGVDLFEPSRCMFESNFPVDRAACSYNACWNAFKRFAMKYSDSEKHSLLFGTAHRAYRLASILEHLPKTN